MMIEIEDSKVEKMSDYAEKMLKYGGKLMQCIEEISESRGGMGQRNDYDDYDDEYDDMGQRGGYGGYGNRRRIRRLWEPWRWIRKPLWRGHGTTPWSTGNGKILQIPLIV